MEIMQKTAGIIHIKLQYIASFADVCRCIDKLNLILAAWM